MKFRILMTIAATGLLMAACGSKEVRIAELRNYRYIVQNEKTGKLGVEFQTPYMQEQGEKPFVVLPVKFDVIDCARGCYFVQWGDSVAVYSAKDGMSFVSVEAHKLADLKSYDLEHKGAYGVPVVMADGTKAHLFTQKYPYNKEDCYVDNEDIILSVMPFPRTDDYLFAGPYDNLYDGFNDSYAALGGIEEPGPDYYVVERDGKFSIGNSGYYYVNHTPFVKQWFDDLVIIQDPGKFIYLCCKNVTTPGLWDVMLYEADNKTDKVRRVEQITDERLAEIIADAGADEKCSEKVYRFAKKYPFNRMKAYNW